MYLWDADRSSWSRPISLYEVTLVSRQQVILHCFYEEIFTSVVVLYQSFFLYNLKQGSDFIQDEDTVDFCWVLSLSVSGGISKCNNSFHQVPLLLQYLFKMWQQWQRHEHYRWEAREKKKKLRGKPVSCVWLEQKKKSVLLKDLHVGTLIVAAGPQTRWLMYCTKTNKQWFISASTLLNILWWKPFVAVGVTLLSNLKARN